MLFLIDCVPFLSEKVDLTAYVEKHEFCFDAVLDENVTNDEVMHPSNVTNGYINNAVQYDIRK
jgi:hypothetical protein